MKGQDTMHTQIEACSAHRWGVVGKWPSLCAPCSLGPLGKGGGGRNPSVVPCHAILFIYPLAG